MKIDSIKVIEDNGEEKIYKPKEIIIMSTCEIDGKEVLLTQSCDNPILKYNLMRNLLRVLL